MLARTATCSSACGVHKDRRNLLSRRHVESGAETHQPDAGIPIARVLGFGPTGFDLERRNFYFVMRDAISFLRAGANGSAREPSGNKSPAG